MSIYLLNSEVFSGFILLVATNEICPQIKEWEYKVLMEVNEFCKSVRRKILEFLRNIFQILVAEVNFNALLAINDSR